MLERPRLFPSVVPPALLLLLLATPGCGARRPDPAAIGAGLEASFPGRSAAVLRAGAGFAPRAGGFRGAVAGLDGGDPQTPGPAGRVAVELPADGAGEIVFRTGGGGAVSVREIGAAGAASTVDRAVAYARPGGASFWTTLPDGAEEWLRFEAGALRDGEPAAVWEIAGATLTQRGEAVEVGVLHGGAGARLRVSAPAAFAEGGAPVEAHLRVRGATIELLVDAGGRGVLVDPKWVPASSMPGLLEYDVSAPLADGRVLVVGGDNGTPPYALPTVYAYDFSTDAWSKEAPLTTARELHTATALGSGKVLVAGGNSDVQPFATTAEIYDPAAKTWASLQMPSDHVGHTATLLKDGTALLAGGWGPGNCGGSMVTNNVDLYDPTLGMDGGWGTSTHMNEARANHAACRLADGTVLVTGGRADNGFPIADTEIYDPAAQTWTLTANPMNTARENHQCALLPDGKVLVAGGDWGADGYVIYASAEVYDPAAQTWTDVQPMATARAWHQIVPIFGGQIMVVGGDVDGSTTIPSTEIYDPVAQTWSAGPTLHEPRESFALSAVGNTVLVSGGYDGTKIGNNQATATAEVINFGAPNGTACTAASTCASGFCAAGLCCDTACTGTCMACTAQLKGTGMDGTCGPVEAGTNPGHQCKDQGAASCGGDGFCDGHGACGTYPDGTVCLETTPCVVAVCLHGTCGGPHKLDGSPCTGGVCIAGDCVPDPGAASSSSSGAGSSSGSTGSSSSGGGAGGGSTSTTPATGQGGQPPASVSLSGNGCAVGPGPDTRFPGTGLLLTILGWLATARRRRP